MYQYLPCEVPKHKKHPQYSEEKKKEVPVLHPGEYWPISSSVSTVLPESKVMPSDISHKQPHHIGTLCIY